MPHLAGKCDCGRNIHFPKNAKLGYQWKCRQCGKVWALSNKGKPLHSQRSKAPPKESYPTHEKPILKDNTSVRKNTPTFKSKSTRKTPPRRKYVPPNTRSKSTFGCGQLVIFAVIGFIVCIVYAVVN